MEKKDFELLSSLLPKTLKDMKIEKPLDETHIIMAWEKLFGNAMSKYVGRIYIKKSVLYVQVTSSLLKQNFFYQKDLILAKLNHHAGESRLKDIVFL